MAKQKNIQLIEAAVEIGQQDGNTEVKLKGRGTISTKKLVTIISIALLIGLTIFAQVSMVGKAVLEAVRHFLTL